MATNNRIFYAAQQVALQPLNPTVAPVPAWQLIHGVQSVGMTTNFNLAQVFELGQLGSYEVIEELPEVQITLNKVLDGHIPIYCWATANATEPTLASRSKEQCNFALSIFDETMTYVTGTPVSQVACSGLYVSSVKYTFQKDGNFTEEVGLVGNNKVWKGDTRVANTQDAAISAWNSSGLFTSGEDAPLATIGIARRQDLRLATNPTYDDTKLPTEVAGILAGGGWTSTDASRAHLNSISVSTTLNRDNVTELGTKGPYARTATYPIEVATEIEIEATSGDMVSATENGIYNNVVVANNPCGDVSGNIKDGTIRIATCEGLRIFCGNKNKLASVNYTGGDTGGGNVKVSYTFNTWNTFTVMHSGEWNKAGIASSGLWYATTGWVQGTAENPARSGYLV